MGWASGSELCEDLFKRVKRLVAKEDHVELARIFIEEFEKHDCDTLQEVADANFKKVLDELYPDEE